MTWPTAERAMLGLGFHTIIRGDATHLGEALLAPPDSPRARSAPTVIPGQTAPTT